MSLIDKARMFLVKQKINELERAIARDPKGYISDVTRRERELEDLKEELREFENGYN